MKTRHPAVEIALILAVVCLLIMVKPCKAQSNYITCRYIPTGVIQTFPGTQCPHDWTPL